MLDEKTDEQNQARGLSRRQFLRWVGAGAATSVLAASGLGLLRPLSAEAAFKAARARRTTAPPTQFDREVATLCEMCVWRCGVRAKVKDERIYKLEGNPFHPHSRGMLCPRGQAGIATAYDPDRLKYPLIRSGPRGSGKWRRLSWNEALDYVAAQMLAIKNQYGAEAMIFSTTHNLVQTQFENMLHAYGTPNYGTQRSLCYNAMITANLLTFGLEEPGRDYSQTQYIIYTGRNMLDCISNSESQDAVSAIARGAKVVVLEPRFTKTAAKATEWLPIRPGTDLAFHLALIQVIIEQGLYDADFVNQYTVGFEDLKASHAELHARMGGQQVRDSGRDDPAHRRRVRPGRPPGVCPSELAHQQLPELLPDRAGDRLPQRAGGKLGAARQPATDRRRGDAQGWATSPNPRSRASLRRGSMASPGNIRWCRSSWASFRSCATTSSRDSPTRPTAGLSIARTRPTRCRTGPRRPKP